MTCRTCRHWQEWDVPTSYPAALRLGDCYGMKTAGVRILPDSKMTGRFATPPNFGCNAWEEQP